MSNLRVRHMAMAVVAAAVGLAACAGAPTVGPTQLDRYSSDDGALFYGSGQLVLIGEADSDEGTRQFAAVAAENVAQGAMSRSNFLLTPYEEGGYAATNRVVVVIGGANGATLCSDPPRQGGSFHGGSLQVAAAACNGERRLSSTRGRIDDVTGPEDPKLAQLFNQIGGELFPSSNPDLEQPEGRLWPIPMRLW